MECIGKGNARQPYDGHTLAEQIEQATILMQYVKGTPKPHTTIVDLGYRGVEVPGVEIIHRDRIKSLTHQGLPPAQTTPGRRTGDRTAAYGGTG